MEQGALHVFDWIAEHGGPVAISLLAIVGLLWWMRREDRARIHDLEEEIKACEVRIAELQNKRIEEIQANARTIIAISTENVVASQDLTRALESVATGFGAKPSKLPPRRPGSAR